MGDLTKMQKERLDITKKVLDDDSLIMTYYPKLGESKGEEYRYDRWRTLINDNADKSKLLRKKKNTKTKTKRKSKKKVK